MGWVVNVYSHFVAICRGAALCDGRGRRERGRVKGKGGQYNGVETAGRERWAGRTAAGRQKRKQTNRKGGGGDPVKRRKFPQTCPPRRFCENATKEK